MKTRLLFLIILLSATSFLHAQADLQNATTLYVSSVNDTLYINGSFTNTSAAALTNNGRLYVRQTLSNSQASMATGTGTLYLTGSANQSIAGTQAFKTFNLVTNNSAGITLNNNLDVSGVHTFTSGIIASSSTPNYLIYQAGASYTGDNDSRHVNGVVKKIGTANFIFPVGNGTIERTAAVINLSAASEINVRYIQPTQNIYNLQGPLVRVQDREYWQIDRISGGTAQIELNWDDGKVPFPLTPLWDIRVANYNTGLWRNAGGTGVGDPYTIGSVTSAAVSTFGPFTIGFTTTALPLDLLAFAAERKTNHTLLTWKTANEQNVDRFEVERSNDAVQFYKVTQVPARNSGTTENYSANDYEAISNIAYYRLRSIDKDGRQKVSGIVSVKVSKDNSSLTLITNPVHDQLVLSAGDEVRGAFNYRIHAMNGQLMQEGSLTIRNAGQYTVPLKGNYSNGTYLLDITNGQESFRYKVVVK